MSRPHSVAEQAVYTRLADNITGATVFQDVPDNFGGDMVVIGEIDGDPLSTKDSTDWTLTLTIISQVTADERAPVIALMDQISELLDRHTFNLDQWKLACSFVTDNAALDESGKEYIGTTRISILALSTL